MEQDETKIRKGKGYKWFMDTKACYANMMSINGYTVDDLDTKTPEQARDPYEEVFVRIRKFLENNSQWCCDDEKDRLNICQGLSDLLKKNHLIDMNKSD